MLNTSFGQSSDKEYLYSNYIYLQNNKLIIDEDIYLPQNRIIFTNSFSHNDKDYEIEKQLIKDNFRVHILKSLDESNTRLILISSENYVILKLYNITNLDLLITLHSYIGGLSNLKFSEFEYLFDYNQCKQPISDYNGEDEFSNLVKYSFGSYSMSFFNTVIPTKCNVYVGVNDNGFLKDIFIDAYVVDDLRKSETIQDENKNYIVFYDVGIEGLVLITYELDNVDDYSTWFSEIYNFRSKISKVQKNILSSKSINFDNGTMVSVKVIVNNKGVKITGVSDDNVIEHYHLPHLHHTSYIK